jgi:hypothetical protein
LRVMRRRKVPFPFAALPKGEFHPRRELGDPYALIKRDAQIVRWFVEDEMQLDFGASPLRPFLDAYERADPNMVLPAFESIPVEQRRYQMHGDAQFERLAWAIWVLYGGGAVEQMDGSFLRAEVLGTDNPQAEQKLPGGIGTLDIAARLVQAGGGRVSIYGNKTAGHDIRWVTGDGDVVLVERKDRSYEAGLADMPERRVRRIVEEINDSHIPKEPGAFRVLVVGFQHLVLAADTEETDKFYQRALEDEFKDTPKNDLPHVVLIEHLGLEAERRGGERNNFFSPQPLNLSLDEMDAKTERAVRLLAQALGADLE